MQTAEGNSVAIPDVPKLSWKKNTQSTFVGALSAALSVTDHPVSERELNGLTALAFRTRWLYYTEKPRWCPSCPVGECGEEISAVCRNVGWQICWKDKVEPATVVASIDRRVPVLVYDTRWNVAVATGYADGGKKLLVLDYSGTESWLEVDKLPPFIITIEGYNTVANRGAAILDALNIATANWHTDHKWNGAAEYWYGKAAFDHWIGDVLEAQDGPGDNPFFVTWWSMDVMQEARFQAANWLSDVATLFPEPVAAQLSAASEIYARENKMLWRAFGVEDAFSGDPEKWKAPAYRLRIADVLTQARDMESQAIGQIEEAVRKA